MNVLFLCTGNSARSIMAEVYLNHIGHGRFRAFSAGSFPKGQVNPIAVDTLELHSMSVGDVRSKSWDEFAAKDAPTLDLVITVCDNAANEVCPIWPGAPLKAHWSFPDPIDAGSFARVFAMIRHSIDKLVHLRLDGDQSLMSKQISEIGPG